MLFTFIRLVSMSMACALLAPVVVLAQWPEARAAGAAGTAADALEEVTVTAEKRRRSLQRTAAAVTAISTADLIAAGVADLRDLQRLVPAARFQAEGNNTQVFLRGVGAGLDQNNVEPNVAFNFDGTYVPREGTSAALFDVQQVEVLPGPQGTLHGRSAIGGTINVAFRRPAFDSAGTALLEYGNNASLRLSGARNLEVTDRLALRLAADYQRSDGFNASGADARDDSAARLSLSWVPDESTSLYLWAVGATKDGHPANLVNKGTDPVTGGYVEDAFLRPDPWDDTRTGNLAIFAPFGSAIAETQRFDTLMLGGELQWTRGELAFTWIPGYVYLDSAPDYWLGTIRAQLTAHYNQVSNELRVAGTRGDRVEWVGGLHAYDVRNAGYLALFTNQPFQFRQSNITGNRLGGYAAFGEWRYRATDRTRLTAGARASTTRREGRGFTSDLLGSQPYRFDRRFDNVDWKLGIERDLAPEAMAYATLQTGFMPGTYNELPATPQADNLVKPSSLLALTLGLKSRGAAGRLQFNPELFLYDYEDLLIQSYDVSAAYNPIFNARRVRIWGAQLDLRYVPGAPAFDLRVGYTNARNRDFATPDGRRYDGLPLAYAPDWTIAAGYAQEQPLAAGSLQWRLDGRYESEWWADYLQNRGVRQRPSLKADASLGWRSPSGWVMTAWVRNVTDEAVLAATAAAGVPGPATAYLEPPRTYGLRLTVDF
jgi:iron complex outermembrane recepter protein